MCRLPPQNYDLRIKFIPHPGPEVWKADEVGYDFPLLALPTQGQICTIFVLQPFEIAKFQTKHPVCVSKC